MPETLSNLVKLAQNPNSRIALLSLRLLPGTQLADISRKKIFVWAKTQLFNWLVNAKGEEAVVYQRGLWPSELGVALSFFLGGKPPDGWFSIAVP